MEISSGYLGPLKRESESVSACGDKKEPRKIGAPPKNQDPFPAKDVRGGTYLQSRSLCSRKCS